MGERKFVQMVMVTYQDGRHAHIWLKSFKKSSSPEPEGRFLAYQVCSNNDSRLNLIYLT